MNDDRPDNVAPAPQPAPVNEREIERMRVVRIIQQQTNQANAARVAKFGPPKYQGPDARQRAADFHGLQSALRRGVTSVTVPIINGGTKK